MTARISKCGHCGETQFTQWYSKSAPRDQYGRIDRDYVDSEPVAYCSEGHRDAADELADAVAAQGALPVPLGHAEPVPQSLEDQLTGTRLSLWEEEQDAKRARFAAKLARQRAAKLRARVAELEALADDAPLSPYYEHPACGFHWHGRDGMDVPARGGQPVCPRCELAALRAHVAEQDRVIDGLRALLPTEPREERGLPNDLAHETGWYGAWQQVAEVLGESLPYARPADEDPIRYSLTPADEWPHSIPAGTPQAVDPQSVGEHCGPNEECHGACPACRPAPTVEALHASSGAVIEVPARAGAAVEALHETPPRPRPVPHDLPEVTP